MTFITHEIAFTITEHGAWFACPDCGRRNTIRNRYLPPVYRKCSKCGEVWSFRSAARDWIYVPEDPIGTVYTFTAFSHVTVREVLHGDR